MARPRTRCHRHLYLFGYRSIARALGIHECTLRRWLWFGKIKLVKWGTKHNSSVALPKSHVYLLFLFAVRAGVLKGLPRQRAIRYTIGIAERRGGYKALRG